uniref:Uncharacterized protein n=1 Tax=Rhodococcus hoagii TaxID=43767 RepID=A0A0F6YRD7_RHOHA|nr:hypothetical protein pVAPN2012_0002 [Prescottella equi]
MSEWAEWTSAEESVVESHDCLPQQVSVSQQGALSVAHCQSRSLKNGGHMSQTNQGQSPPIVYLRQFGSVVCRFSAPRRWV